MNDSKFKYSIQINQKAVIDNNLDIDIIDYAIFDLLKDFSLSKECKKMIVEDKTYYFFGWRLISHQLPMIKIKSRQGINKRINKLIDCQLLERYENNKEENKAYFAFGANYDKMIFTCKQESQDVNNGLHVPVNNGLHPPVNNRLHNNSTSNDNNTINTIDNSIDLISDLILEFDKSEEPRQNEIESTFREIIKNSLQSFNLILYSFGREIRSELNLTDIEWNTAIGSWLDKKALEIQEFNSNKHVFNKFRSEVKQKIKQSA